jgi:hypothetical protein
MHTRQVSAARVIGALQTWREPKAFSVYAKPTHPASTSEAMRSNCAVSVNTVAGQLVVEAWAWQTGVMQLKPVVGSVRKELRANPSLNHRTRYGKAPWPRSRAVHLRPRGQGALPHRAG